MEMVTVCLNESGLHLSGRHLRLKRSRPSHHESSLPMVRFACPEPSASASTLDGPSQSRIRKSPHPRLKKSVKKNHTGLELDRIKIKFAGPLPRRTIYVGNVSASWLFFTSLTRTIFTARAWYPLRSSRWRVREIWWHRKHHSPMQQRAFC